MASYCPFFIKFGGRVSIGERREKKVRRKFKNDEGEEETRLKGAGGGPINPMEGEYVPELPNPEDF